MNIIYLISDLILLHFFFHFFCTFQLSDVEHVDIIVGSLPDAPQAYERQKCSMKPKVSQKQNHRGDR
jgi:hypothetical protein